MFLRGKFSWINVNHIVRIRCDSDRYVADVIDGTTEVLDTAEAQEFLDNPTICPIPAAEKTFMVRWDAKASSGFSKAPVIAWDVTRAGLKPIVTGEFFDDEFWAVLHPSGHVDRPGEWSVSSVADALEIWAKQKRKK